MLSEAIYPGQSQDWWVYSLTNRGVIDDSATVSLTLLDSAGHSFGPFGYTFVAGPQTRPDGTLSSDGNYRYQASGTTTAAFAPGIIYAGTLSVTPSGGSAQPIPMLAIGMYPTGAYGKINDIYFEMGEFNALAAGDPDNTANVATTAIMEQTAINFADSFINSELARNNFAVPTTVNLAMLRTIFAKLGSWNLYQIRGLDDAKDPKAGRFQVKYSYAVKQLRKLIIWSQINPGSTAAFTLATGQSNASPQSIAPHRGRFGDPFGGCRVPAWGNGCWSW